jgi:hypothetical protein
MHQFEKQGCRLSGTLAFLGRISILLLPSEIAALCDKLVYTIVRWIGEFLPSEKGPTSCPSRYDLEAIKGPMRNSLRTAI